MFDFHVLWMGKYYQSWENGAHSHNYFQMMGIVKGSGTMEIGDETYSITDRQVFLIPPKCMHAVSRQPGAAPPQLLDIKFSVSDEHLLADLSSAGAVLRCSDFNQFQRYFERILEESESHKPYYYQRVCHYFGLLLTSLLREVQGQAPQVEQPAIGMTPIGACNGVDMDGLMHYIHQNYATIISLGDLAAMANTSKTTLIQAFKTVYGTTPIQYINSVRISKAKELLTNTDTSIGEISELIGFQSIHYFSRYFKSRVGISPVEYRLRHSQSHFYSYRTPAEETEENF